MVSTDKSKLRFEQVVERIQQYTHHDLLHSADVKPIASQFHFEVGWTILQSANVPESDITRVIHAVLLLQEGLSIHDDVDDDAGLQRQLRVLAGDYCSGWYYWILARVGDDELLMGLCDAVMRVNEAKMSLYRLPAGNTSGYMTLQETVEGELLYALARHFLTDSATWISQLQSLVRAYVVKQEMARRRVPKNFTVRQAYDWLTDAIDRMLHIQPGTILQPISAFVMDYFVPTKKVIEAQTLAEGNR